ncbi:hypothetical protein NE237_000738 [Protea cynaroides]|uniref:Protein kinase domain-containing protein n=1 Tax=Protea cynaroides TaxID=273540 RepID=A0A9Q0KS17_9MAGN|nr:hypothetical protein NE237_000738 [Protea cynaroides]
MLLIASADIFSVTVSIIMLYCVLHFNFLMHVTDRGPELFFFLPFPNVTGFSAYILVACIVCASACLSRKEDDEGQRDDKEQLAIEDGTVEMFIGNMDKEKPVQFLPEQLARFTQDYSIRLGSGGFGVVYRGQFPNGMMLAVKVLNDSVSKTVLEKQFMAEVSTIG